LEEKKLGSFWIVVLGGVDDFVDVVVVLGGVDVVVLVE